LTRDLDDRVRAEMSATARNLRFHGTEWAQEHPRPGH
jgi:hypothetical protein